ncbi:hypothetical protein SAMN05518672_11212 [Chitinophaga sp. CF118]|nr:hypothetical protein SAMN05518672_11212 [Chitinophaga sp. CF118]
MKPFGYKYNETFWLRKYLKRGLYLYDKKVEL